MSDKKLRVIYIWTKLHINVFTRRISGSLYTDTLEFEYQNILLRFHVQAT